MDETFQTLTNLIKQYDCFVIMSHNNIDLDGLGASLCLNHIIETLGKNSSVFFYNNSQNSSVKKALKRLKDSEYKLPFISNLKKIKNPDRTLLIILDTHRQTMLEEQQLLSIIPNVVIIDHHIKMPDYIKKTILTYINVNVSSVIEIMTMYLQYLNIKINPLLATIMLSGLEIDTNGYSIKTTENTYIVSSLLSKMGADNIIKQELMQENREVFLNKMRQLENSHIYNGKYAVCVMDDVIHGREELAMISELQLKFEHIQAAFTIGKIDNNVVGISARSLGYVNVEKIMKLMGGGGHVTDAAAQITTNDVTKVTKKLEKILS